MRRHFDSKHSELKLKLPKEADRHACSCGRTFLEPNRLQEHMEVRTVMRGNVRTFSEYSRFFVRKCQKISREKAVKDVNSHVGFCFLVGV